MGRAHFKTYQNNQKTVRCLLCDKDLQYDKSTSSLTRHLFAMHPARHQEITKAKLVEKVPPGPTGMENYLLHGNRHEQDETLLQWVVETYQPYAAVEAPSFRAMIMAHNRNATPTSNKHLKKMVAEKIEVVKECVDCMVKAEKGAVTSDGWTSKANDTYYCFTFHWICKDFLIHSIPLGIVHHKGTTTAVGPLKRHKSSSNPLCLRKEFLKEKST